MEELCQAFSVCSDTDDDINIIKYMLGSINYELC